MTDYVVAVLVVAVAVYGTSASAKLRSRGAYRSFQAGLGETALLPGPRLALVAGALAGTETIVAAAAAASAFLVALSGPGSRAVAEGVLAAAAVLTAVLAAGVGVTLQRGTRTACACFGPGSARPLSRAHLLRNLSLLAALLAAVAGNGLSGRPGGGPALAGVFLAAVAAAAIALLLIRLDDLVELFTPVSRGGGASAR